MKLVLHVHNYVGRTRRVRDSGDFKESEHPRADNGQFGSGGSGAQATSGQPAKRAAPGSQLHEQVKTQLRGHGMVGTFPPADVPLSAIKVANLTKGLEELKFQPLMSWDQRTRSGRVSRQYRYTQEFHDRNAAEKFARVAALEPHLPKIAEALTKQLTDPALSPKQRDAAAIASVIRETGLRPTDGDESIQHGHFGISSLQARHARVEGGEVHLDFIGKEGVRNQTVVREPANVAYLQAALAVKHGEAPLFGAANSTDAGNALKAASVAVGGPADVKVKDLRTLKATSTARAVAARTPVPALTGDEKRDVRALQKAILAMSAEVSQVLNNTPEQARDNYIHPEIFRSWARKK